MSEQPQGPGWWLASDGKYYPPQPAPGVAQAPTGQTAVAPTQSESPKKPIWKRWWFWLLVILLIFVVVAVASTSGGDDDTAATVTPTEEPATEADQPEPEPEAEEPEPEPEAEEPEPEPEFTTSPDDWAVNLVVSEKQCFGSAGCNVTVEPELDYLGTTPLPDTGTVIIRVSISGDESGEIIETYEATLSTGQFSYNETYMSTASEDVVPEATVTTAEYRTI